jgi:hypothetical protein
LPSHATAGDDINLIVAADQNIRPSAIADQFSDDVAALVEEATDDKSLPDAKRKCQQVEEAPNKSRCAKIPKLADKISTSGRAPKTRPIGETSGSRNMCNAAERWSGDCAGSHRIRKRGLTRPPPKPSAASGARDSLVDSRSLSRGPST